MKSNYPQPESVLFLTRKWPPAVGGMETYSVKLTEELAGRLTVATWMLPGRKDGLPPRFISILAFAFRAAWKYLTLKRLPSVLHIGDLAAWPLGLLSRMRRSQAVVVISAHGTDVSFHRRKGWKGALYGAYLRLGSKLNRDTTVIANSAATAAAAAETGWRTTKVIPLATDIDQPAPTSDHNNEVLFAGRLIERKGCLWFVRNVLPLLPAHVRLNIAGPVWDEAERAVFDDPRVTWLGSLDRQELCREYRRALCLIVPNIDPPSGEFEGFGLVAAEAAAAGGLVLAAATGGLVEAVIEGETGFLVPPSDAPAWAARIREIESWSVEQRTYFLRNAWRLSREVFTWSRVADEVMAVYKQALKCAKTDAAGPRQIQGKARGA